MDCDIWTRLDVKSSGYTSDIWHNYWKYIITWIQDSENIFLTYSEIVLGILSLRYQHE
jgi:hypothetical protein